MLFIFLTKEVLKLDKSIDIKLLQELNIYSILVTEVVSNLYKLILVKEEQLKNK
jgi:hypothetical protein